jgi:methionyl-tRNA formyltransferase
MRIVFFGTPEFAAVVLDHLVRTGEDVAGVVTAPDRPAGRGLNLTSSPVKNVALNHQLLVMQPENLQALSFLLQLQKLQADVFVVVAFRKLPPEVWTMPPRGTFNLHASLLPAYRGAAPIHHAIINGETITGLTTFFINDKIDEGRIILQRSLKIDPDDTAGPLYEKLKQEAPLLVSETLRWLETHSYEEALPQPTGMDVPKAPKLTPENTRINWNLPPSRLRNFIRGLSPQPGAWCFMEKEDGSHDYWKILKARAEEDDKATEYPHVAPGTPVIARKELKIRCAGGWIIPELLVRQGRKPQSNKDFLNGLHNIGIRLSHI